MRMGRYGIGLLAALFGSPTVLAAPSRVVSAAAPAIAPIADVRSEVPVYSYGHSHPGYRSRGKQARPRKRPNRLHISRRVRRSHRRSKAA